MTGEKFDVKDIRISGCQVHLTFHAVVGNWWSVGATILCGIADNAREESFETQAYSSREEAETEALRLVKEHLGHNIDRNTSRVNNGD